MIPCAAGSYNELEQGVDKVRLITYLHSTYPIQSFHFGTLVSTISNSLKCYTD